MEGSYFTFPAVKGIQATMEYFITMIPIPMLIKLFSHIDEELNPEERAQRILSKQRIPEMSNYVLSNPQSYIFSALTASVDGDIRFIPSNDSNPQIGTVNIDSTSRFLINDGQHRLAALQRAIKENPKLKYEHMSMVLYHDIGLKRSQQMFSDLNRYAIRPTKSLNILYDHRDKYNNVINNVIDRVPYFKDFVDKEHVSIPKRSRYLFSLSAIYKSTVKLLDNMKLSPKEQENLAVNFWVEVGSNIQDWQNVLYEEEKPSEVRDNSLASTSLALYALADTGNKLIKEYPDNWKFKLEKLQKIDWCRNNPVWENGIVLNGKILSSHAAQTKLTQIVNDLLM